MKKAKISVIHVNYLKQPAEAQPSGENYTDAAALEYIRANLDMACEFMHAAGKDGADIVCTNEDFVNAGGYDNALIEKATGEIGSRLRAIAKQYSMYVASNNNEITGGKKYNVSTLYGRDGEVTGKYRKVHLADRERWESTPGDAFPVFETDIGNIGFAICYDMCFPEVCRILSLNGADIVIHQTQGWGTLGKSGTMVGEAFMRTRAAENCVYVIVAKVNFGNDEGRSCVINNYGNFIAESSRTEDELLTAEFALDFDLYDKYGFDNYFAGVLSTKARQLLARRPDLYSAFTDMHPALNRKYFNYKLADTPEAGRKIMEDWESKTESEKKKYYWQVL